MKIITVEIKDESYEKIQSLIDAENVVNKFQDKGRKYRDIEDFVKGSIGLSIKHFHERSELIKLAGLDDPSRPFKYRNKFKKIMKEKGIKQIDMANFTGINRSNLNLILNNNTQPRLDFFLRIWIILGQPPIQDCIYRIDED